MNDDLIKIVLDKLEGIESKVERTHKWLFESNGHGEALIVTVKNNTKKINEMAEEEKGKFIRYIITAGKISLSMTAIGGFVVGAALLVTKLL